MAIPLLLLNPYVDAILVIALGICIGGIMNALTPYIAKIPWVGGAIANAVSGMAQSITHACGVILAPISDAVGGTFHAVARLIDWTYGEFHRHASLLLDVALLVSGLALAFRALRALVHSTAHGIAAVLPRVKSLEKEYHGIEHRVKTLERDLAQGIGHDLRIRVKALEGEVAKVEDKVIPNIRSIAQGAEAEVTGLRKWITDNVPLIGTVGLTGAVAWALSELGLGGLRCNNLLNSMNKRGCGLWSGIEDLLGLFVDTLLLTNVCTLVPVLESAVSAVADPLVIALTDVGAGLCSGGIGPAPALPIPALSLPANPGFTLNLP